MSYANSMFNFLRNPQTPFHMAKPFYIPTSHVRGADFPTATPTQATFLFENVYIFIYVIVISTCISLMPVNIGPLPELVPHEFTFFRKLAMKFLAHFLIESSFFVCYTVKDLCIFWVPDLIRYMVYKYFPPF